MRETATRPSRLSSDKGESGWIYGGNGSDTIYGGAGSDLISAGDGGTTTTAHSSNMQAAAAA